LGLEPTLLGDELLDTLMKTVIDYKDRVDQRLIMPGVNWKESQSVAKNITK
jgi:UDP-sulfoquinovose synthase